MSAPAHWPAPKPLSASEKGFAVQEQRYLPALRAHIDKLLGKGWVIAQRDPLTLRLGRRTCLVMHGMLISEGVLWNHPTADPSSHSSLPRQNAASPELPLAAAVR